MAKGALGAIRRASALPAGVTAAVLYSSWQFLVEQKLFLHTLLMPRMSGSDVPALPLGYANVIWLKLFMAAQQLSRRPDAYKDRQFAVYRRVRRRLERRGVNPGPVRPVAEYDAAQLDPQVFYREHVRKATPCVIRRFYQGDLEPFRFRSLAESFPDAVAQATDIEERRIASVTMRELQIDHGRRYDPQQVLLDQDPQLRATFQLDHVRPYFPVLGRASSPVVSFLILGMRKGLSAEFHCEESTNWYMAVSGRKHWTLVESEYSWLMYPAGRGDGMRRFSEFKPGDDGNPQDTTRFDLFEYAPKLEVELHPGDVLYFPAWMWHKTVNLDDEGLGVTLRYAPRTPMSNRYFRALQLISPSFWKSTVDVVGGKVRGDLSGLEEAGGFNEQELALL